VIGGLGLSTLVTLLAVPSLYVALRARRDRDPSAPAPSDGVPAATR